MKMPLNILFFLLIPVLGSSQVFHYSKLDGQRFNQSINSNSSYNLSVSDSTIQVSGELEIDFLVIKKYEVELNGKSQVHYLVEDIKNTGSLDHTFDIVICQEIARIESLDIDEPQYYNFTN